MAFRIDDDENRIQDLKDQIDQLEIQTFSPEVVARNESTRNTGVQTGDAAATNAYPQWMPIRDFGSVGNLTLDILLNRTDSHVAKLIAIGDIDFAFSLPPGTNKKMEFILDVTIDGIGGYTFNLLNNILPAGISIDNSANARTVIRFTTTDAGVTYYAEDISNPATGGASNTIFQEDSSVTVIDAGVGNIAITVDNFLMMNINRGAVVVHSPNPPSASSNFTMFRDDPSPANGDLISSLHFGGRSDVGNAIEYGKIETKITNVVDASVSSEMSFILKDSGADFDALVMNGSQVTLGRDLDMDNHDVINIDRLQISGGTGSATSVNDVVWYLSTTGDLISNINATDGWIWTSGNITKLILTDSTLEKRNVTAPVFQLYNTRTAQTGTAGTINILANTGNTPTGISMGFIIADTEIETGDGSGSMKLGVNFNSVPTIFISLNENNNSQIDIFKETDFNSQDARDINRLHLSGGTTSALGVDEVSWYLTSNDDLVSNIGAGSEWGWSSDNIIKLILTDSTLEKRNVTAPVFQLYNTRTAQTGTAGTINILANTGNTPTGISMGFIIADTEIETGDGSGSMKLGVNLNGIATSLIELNDSNDGSIKIKSALNVDNNVINTIKELQFDISNTFIPVTVGIGFNVTGVMMYTLPLATHFHDFRINDESMFTISRFGTNQGQIQTSIITATDFLIAEEILDFATFDNTTPSNGNVWLNLSGEFQFRENGVTVGLGGGSQIAIDGIQDAELWLDDETDQYNFEMYHANCKVGSQLTSSHTLIEDASVFVPIYIGERARLVKISIDVTTGGTGTYNMEFGIYSRRTFQNYPETLLASNTGIFTGTGVKTIIFAEDLEAGMYFLAILVTSADSPVLAAPAPGEAISIGFQDQDIPDEMRPLMGYLGVDSFLPSTADDTMFGLTNITPPAVFAKFNFNPN